MKLGQTLDGMEIFTTLINGLTALGKEYTSKEMVLKEIRGLPKNWDIITVAMRELKNLLKISLHEFFSDLKACEFKIKNRIEEEATTSAANLCLKRHKKQRKCRTIPSRPVSMDMHGGAAGGGGGADSGWDGGRWLQGGAGNGWQRGGVGAGCGRRGLRVSRARGWVAAAMQRRRGRERIEGEREREREREIKARGITRFQKIWGGGELEE
ncbi:hypothetical protein Pfo_001922 [Paulownia fortunei]|nr:hypothetical protein Pfo_001922 [Paulownia fortunei]